MVHKLGYGNWDELKAAFRTSPLFRFDWFVKSRTTQELARRCDTLIRLVEKENQEYDERERQARKEKKKARMNFLLNHHSPLLYFRSSERVLWRFLFSKNIFAKTPHIIQNCYSLVLFSTFLKLNS